MLFSVIIPLYNKAPYIEKTISSVLAQTFSDYELIVVDDGSTDASATVAEQMLKRCPQPYQLIRQANAGVSMARNNGVKAAKGAYICFLDGDDWWAPAFLEKMDKLIQDCPDAGLHCSNYYYVHNGKEQVKLDIPTGYFNYCKEYARTLCMIATSSICLKKDIFDACGGFNPCLKMGEDFDLLIRVALKYGAAIINEPLVYFNNDLPVAHRATHHLHNPNSHFLWNLGYLEDEEQTNPDYKQLIDNLRTHGLLRYYLSTEYHDAAKQQLAKVDWSKQAQKWQRLYRMPLCCLRLRQTILQTGSDIKHLLQHH